MKPLNLLTGVGSLLLLSCFAVHAETGPTTAAALLQLCKTDPQAETTRNQVSDLVCVYYLTGFLDGYLGGSMLPQGKALCVPQAGVPSDLLKAIVVKYLLKHEPELSGPGFTARVAMLQALRQEYPCATADH